VVSKLDEKIPELSDEEDILNGSMEIDFIQKKEPTTSIATVKCKIGRLKIPAMALDSCAELPIITPEWDITYDIIILYVVSHLP
jgi:hypothetical protein